ncbi:alpha-ketoglutarate-dependent dioxygenase AlkB [Laspinema olomoucense]|uniref:alpha-ketoglutarate-dependent dioxygenase AlkB n=1 Tax=Laspinema olomoucense TaxID=3231600 RepID=UPI0021BB78B2|nr:alpha-ketoglutarate-dependent dioxygenase AlkB [Laspinema sp. D3c]MCT7992501.1 alpha-ketoglutarate-dependent dioxygenase AlkB [Laspinema sp. D3c]
MPIIIKPGFASSVRTQILSAVDTVIEEAPLYQAAVGDRGGKMRYSMTNCGTFGWWSTQGYTKINPMTNQRWPDIPPAILNLIQPIGEKVYPGFQLQTVAIDVFDMDMNRPDKPILNFHQDTSERNKQAPIISISFGSGTFIVAGQVDGQGRIPAAQLRRINRTMTTTYELKDADLVVLYGDERLCFYGAGKVSESSELGNKRISITGRMVDPLNQEDKPIIFSFVGNQSIETLTPPIIEKMEEAMTFRKTLNPQPKNSSEILVGSLPGFDRPTITHLRSKKYPSVFIYNMGNENVPQTYPVRNVGNEPAPLMEMLEEADYLLLATNGTEKRTQYAKNYFETLNKPIWEVLVEDERTDEGEPENIPDVPEEEPPSTLSPNRRANSIGHCRVTNIRDTGSFGFSSTNWHTPDYSRVYIGRGGSQGIARSPMNNPYPIGKEGTREDVLDKFRKYSWPLIRDELAPFYPAIYNVASLLAQGKPVELVCHCDPLPCHGHIIHKAALWMIENNRVPYEPDAPVESDTRLHLGMAGLSNLIGNLTPRMELEIETLLENKHRKWYLKLNDIPTRNPVVHIRDNPGFDRFVQQYLISQKYQDVVVHGQLPSNLPTDLNWTTSSEPLTSNLNYLFVQWDAEDTELQQLMQQFNQLNKTLIAYVRKPKINLPDPIPKLDDPQRFAKYGAAVPNGSYVAVIGSRKFRSAAWAKGAITQFINALPGDCKIVSGGAKGADSYAEDAAIARGLPIIVHPANWVQTPKRDATGQIDPNWRPKLIPSDRRIEDSNERSNAGTERNKVIVDDCNCLYAFIVRGGSSGSEDATQYAALKDKHNLEMVFEEGAEEVERVNSRRSTMNLFFFEEGV